MIDMMPKDMRATYDKIKEMAKHQKKFSRTYVDSLIKLEKACPSQTNTFPDALRSIPGAPSARVFLGWKKMYETNHSA